MPRATGKPLQIAVDGVPGTTEAAQHLVEKLFARGALPLRVRQLNGIGRGRALRLDCCKFRPRGARVEP